jgi:hypothetical protein
MVLYTSFVMLTDYAVNAPLYIEAQLGNPQASCAGFGICTVDVLQTEEWIQYRPHHIRRAKARLWYITKRGLLFFFPKDGMLIPTRAHFFMPGNFKIDEPFLLPEPICQSLGLTTCLIPSGLFACKQEEEGYALFISESADADEIISDSWLPVREFKKVG